MEISLFFIFRVSGQCNFIILYYMKNIFKHSSLGSKADYGCVLSCEWWIEALNKIGFKLPISIVMSMLLKPDYADCSGRLSCHSRHIVIIYYSFS